MSAKNQNEQTDRVVGMSMDRHIQGVLVSLMRTGLTLTPLGIPPMREMRLRQNRCEWLSLSLSITTDLLKMRQIKTDVAPVIDVMNKLQRGEFEWRA